MIKRQPVKPIPVMERTVPKSKKYAHIEGKLDTGLTIHKVKTITAHEYRMRRDEIFYRITKNQLYELYNEYEADERETIGGGGGSSPDYRSESGPRIVTYSEQDQPNYIKPYLILDVREVENYNICHLLQAKSYPYTFIRRDYLLPEIYQFKNKEEKLIILYCDDERISRDTAKTMVDRGIDNVYLLEGGLKEFASYYPAFVEGQIPERLLMTPPKSSSLTRSRLSSIPEDRRSMISGGSRSILSAGLSSLRPSAYTSRRTSGLSSLSRSRDGQSDAGMSTMSTKSVAESVISRASARKGKY